MKRLALSVAVLLLASLDASAAGQAASAAPAKTPTAVKWVEGRNYYLIQPPRPTGLPAGKVEVTEVFSYACPACNQFQPYMRKLKQTMPPNTVVDYLHFKFIVAGQENDTHAQGVVELIAPCELDLGDQCHVEVLEACLRDQRLAGIPGVLDGDLHRALFRISGR